MIIKQLNQSQMHQRKLVGHQSILKFHIIREAIQERRVELKSIAFNENYVDEFTKGLDTIKLKFDKTMRTYYDEESK